MCLQELGQARAKRDVSTTYEILTSHGMIKELCIKALCYDITYGKPRLSCHITGSGRVASDIDMDGQVLQPSTPPPDPHLPKLYGIDH